MAHPIRPSVLCRHKTAEPPRTWFALNGCERCSGRRPFGACLHAPNGSDVEVKAFRAGSIGHDGVVEEVLLVALDEVKTWMTISTGASDADLLSELELTANLIVAASEFEQHLTHHEIDHILGVVAQPRQKA